MLNLTPQGRKTLLMCDALTSNEEGDEVLRGLTVSESCFVLRLDNNSSSSSDAAEYRLYLQLKSMHLAARALYVASL